MSEESTSPETTIREVYVQVMGPGRMEDGATVDVLPRFFADDVELLQMRSILGTSGCFRGHQGVVESTLEILREFVDVSFIPQKVHAVGDRVGTVALFSGKGRRSGAPVEIRVSHLFTLRDGLIVRWDVFEDPSAALKAVGLEE